MTDSPTIRLVFSNEGKDMNARMEDISGRTFGRWTALSFAGRRSGSQIWECQCQCGTIREVAMNNLKSGKSRSCGCLQREIVAEIAYRHGMSSHPLYGTWCNIKSRCTDPRNENWSSYGGRGITMHPSWQDDFWAFLDDVSVGWRPWLSLDRIENDGKYEPGNVRWATSLEQAANRRLPDIASYPRVKSR